MNVTRGDIVLADFPHATGTQSSRRPVLVVQSDHYNRRIDNAVNLVTLYKDRFRRTIGRLSDEAMQRIDECLRAALGIP